MYYALSDVHGNREHFESIMEQINLQPEDTLFVLGDVIDRYPYGIEILRTIMDMPNARMLLGNHEYMMLRALGCPYDGPLDIAFEDRRELAELWIKVNGGLPTFQSWKALSARKQTDIIDYLHAVPLNIDTVVDGAKFKLVHAAPVEFYEEFRTADDQTKTFYAVWNRDTVGYMPDTDYTLVFGHTPTIHMQDENPLKVYRREKLIGIDCGSGLPAPTWFRPLQGRLSCVRLDDGKEFYAEVKRMKAVV